MYYRLKIELKPITSLSLKKAYHFLGGSRKPIIILNWMNESKDTAWILVNTTFSNFKRKFIRFPHFPATHPPWVEAFIIIITMIIKTSSTGPSGTNRIVYKLLMQPQKHLHRGKLKNKLKEATNIWLLP